jgi:hypothetical protein
VFVGEREKEVCGREGEREAGWDAALGGGLWTTLNKQRSTELDWLSLFHEGGMFEASMLVVWLRFCHSTPVGRRVEVEGIVTCRLYLASLYLASLFLASVSRFFLALSRFLSCFSASSLSTGSACCEGKRAKPLQWQPQGQVLGIGSSSRTCPGAGCCLAPFLSQHALWPCPGS